MKSKNAFASVIVIVLAAIIFSVLLGSLSLTRSSRILNIRKSNQQEEFYQTESLLNEHISDLYQIVEKHDDLSKIKKAFEKKKLAIEKNNKDSLELKYSKQNIIADIVISKKTDELIKFHKAKIRFTYTKKNFSVLEKYQYIESLEYKPVY